MADCISIWCSAAMRERCIRGNKENVLTAALDGSEDHLGRTTAWEMWQEIGMGELRDEAVAD
eukprot:3242137-Alexandrium_andersonii.AAC.1